MISQVASRCLQARDIAHRSHWAASSYAVHGALNEFYDNLLDAIDELIECYQGQYGQIECFEVETRKVDDISAYLREEADWIEENRNNISQGSQAIAALVDVLVSVYLKAVYKLEHLV